MGLAELLTTVTVALQVGKATVGRAVIIRKPSRTCDLLLKNRDMGGYRQWGMTMTVQPQKLEFRNCQQQQYRFEVMVARLSAGGRDVRERSGSWTPITLKHDTPDRMIHFTLEPIPETWVEERVSMWEIIFDVVMAGQRRALYKGNPTAVRTEKEP